MPNSGSPLRQEERFFPVAPDQLGAAHSWLEHGERTPRKPRLASSVVLVRDGAAGTETYLGYRSGSSPLGTVAFPGGSLEETDDEPVTWFGPPPAKWAETLGLGDHRLARAHVVAAVRELFEETGVLLAGPDESSLPESTSGADWMRSRQAVAGQEKSFAEVLGRRGLGVRTDLLKPLSNWLSPDFAHRRFDTRYFAAAQPASQRPSLLAGKGAWAAWLPARELVARRDTPALGDLVDQPDTRGLTFSEVTSPAVEIIVEKIATARGCIAYLSHKRPQRLYQPELVLVDGRPMLQVAASTAAEGGAIQRGR